jgi:hypothetical protein
MIIEPVRQQRRFTGGSLMTAAASPRGTIRDHFVTIAEAPAELLQAVKGRLPRLEAFAAWPDRADAPFLTELGKDLFRIAFAADQTYADFVQALADTVAADGTLRLWLYVQDAGLAVLPWEYLCLTAEAVDHCRMVGMNLPAEAAFLALHPNVSLVRQTNPTPPEPEIQRIGALRVLLAWADPGPLPDGRGWPALGGAELEVETVRKVLQGLRETHCEVHPLPHATRESLAEAMHQTKPHVLHLSCHGGFPGLDDPLDDLDAPSLVLERRPHLPKRPHAYLTAGELRSLCADAGTQVVVLNACWGGRSQPALSGIGHTLSTGARPVPVVLAHQLPIPQHAAVGFARPFYQNLSLARSLEEGVRTFRKDCVNPQANAYGCGIPDWGVPVVFLNVKNSALFESVIIDERPFNFGELIQEHVPIVGRQFLRDQLAALRARQQQGVLLITAPPGVGKTAFVAQLAEDDRQQAHFFYRDPITVDPDDWVKQVWLSLTGRHGLLAEMPADPVDRRKRLPDLLAKVGECCLRKGAPELLLLDGLDEAKTTRDGKNAVDVLPPTWPRGVFLLATSRPGPLAEALAGRPGVVHFPIDPSGKDNRDDAAAYCRREMRGRLTDADEPALAAEAEWLAAKAENNFLVLKDFLRPSSELGARFTRKELREKAAGLTGVVEDRYRAFFDRVNGRAEAHRRVVYTTLGALATAQDDVSPEQIAAAFGLDQFAWDEALKHLGQFLVRGGLRQEDRGTLTYRLYHKTFIEFLHKRLALDMRNCHQRWAEYHGRWRQLAGYARLYALRHLPAHVLEACRLG